MDADVLCDRRLLAVYGVPATHWAAVLLTGSGTAALEAMIASLVPGDGRLLVLENGVYGERMGTIAERRGIPHWRLSHEWGAALDADALAAALRESPDVTHCAVAHHDTTTGRLDALDAVAAVCRAHGVARQVDAVSSFGAEAIELGTAPIAACAGTADMCLHGAPGVAFVVVRRDARGVPTRGAASIWISTG